jgi:hypothetical protein
VPSPEVVDYLGKQEIIFCGPDENTAELMDWACLHGRARGYPFWKAFTTGACERAQVARAAVVTRAVLSARLGRRAQTRQLTPDVAPQRPAPLPHPPVCRPLSTPYPNLCPFPSLPFTPLSPAGKGFHLGGVPHDKYAMTTRGVRAYVTGIQRKFGLLADSTSDAVVPAAKGKMTKAVRRNTVALLSRRLSLQIPACGRAVARALRCRSPVVV